MFEPTWDTDEEYIDAMMKRFKLVDMREQYRDLIQEAEASSMGYGAFSGCSQLASVTLLDCVTAIGIRAFTRCSSLT